MKNITNSDIEQYYTDVLNRLKPYTKFHFEIIKIILSEMDKHLETTIVNGSSKYCCFGGDHIAEKSGLIGSIVYEILNDFVRDGLLWVSNRNNETIVYTLTDRGVNCFDKIFARRDFNG